MIEILKPTVECAEISNDGSYGKYVVAPLERGYGTTLGNSLRRVLLSSLTGAAVTAIRIDNVYHLVKNLFNYRLPEFVLLDLRKRSH